MKHKNWIIGIGIAAILLLSACNVTTGTPNSDEKTYKLKVGYLQANGAPLADIAVDEGFFEKEHLKVELIPFSASTDGLNALQSKKIDIGLTFGTSGPLAFISQGSDFDIIGGHMEGGHPIVVKEGNKSKYKSLQDYKGKKIGTVRLGTPDIVFKAALQESGINIEKDVTFIDFKSVTAVLEAVASGKVDVGVSGTGHLSKAEKIGLTPVLWSNDINPKHVCCRVTVRGASTEEQAVAYKKFLKGLIQAERIKLESPEKALKATKVHFKLDDKTVNEIVNEPHLHNTADPNKKEVVKMWEQMKNLGYVKNGEKIDINKHFNLSFYEQALNELIKEHPNDDYYKKQLENYKKQNT